MARLINIGFGNVVNSQKIVAVVSPDAAPVKRMVQSIKGTRSLIGGQFGIADRAAARAGSALSDSVQRIVNQDLASAITQNQNDNYAGYTQFGNFVRSGAYNLSNYYTVGLLFNMMA